MVLVNEHDAPVNIDSFFPNKDDPFAIKRSLQLGKEGYNLTVIDRGMAGHIPDATSLLPLNMVPFGVSFNGAILDPSGPWYDGGPADPKNPFDRTCSGWEYEVTHPAVMKLVGVPAILQGHVQPNGLFHYHGYSTTLIYPLRYQERNPDRLQLIGYSADGFPIIDCRLRMCDGTPARLESGYLLRSGFRSRHPRTNPALTPSGRYDGLFVQDYEYVPGARRSDAGALVIPLDQRNGIVLGDDIPALPGFPNRHYAYAMTHDWPMIPRYFACPPDPSFAKIIPLKRFTGSERSRLYETCGARADIIRGLDGRAPY